MTRTRTVTVTVWTLAALLLALAAGTTARAEEEERLALNFEGPIEIETLIQEVAKAIDLPLVWDPKSRALQNKQATGDVSLVGTKGEILGGLRSLLTFYELVLVPVGADRNEKYLIMDARQTAAIVKLKPTYVELDEDNLAHFETLDGVFLTTTIKVEHMENLRDARNALNRIVSGQNIGNVTEVPAARAFVVTDFAPNVVAIYRLIREMDVPHGEGGDAAAIEEVFQAVRLKHASAGTAAATLTAHFTADMEESPRMQPQRGPQPTGDVPPRPALRIDADERLNQVLISGMRRDVDRVLEVIQAIDQPLSPINASVQVIRLEHVRAIEVEQVLNQLIRRFPGPWLATPGAKDLPAIEAHDATNAILLHAGEEAAAILRRVITEMDQPELETEPADR
jgi:type II secretory pathway component GspD/PulD (secretin)